MKKILSFVLALALVLAVAAPAFATSTPGSQEIIDPSKLATGVTNKVTGQTSVGTLKVTVPTSNTVVLNPYGLSLKVADGKLDDTNGTPSTATVITPMQYIKNESTSKVKVSVVATGTAAGNAKFSDVAIDNDDADCPKTNSVCLALVWAAATATEPTSAVALPSDLTAAGVKAIVLSTRASAKTEMETIPAGDTAAQYMAFNLAGNAVKAPTTPWTTKDTVGATLAFTFDLVAA